MVLCPNTVALIYNGAMLRSCQFRPTQLLARTVLGFVLALMLSSPSHARTQEAAPLRIAVAANFRAPAEQLAREFQQQSGVSSRIITASTGILATQLRRGAPFDLLLAADQQRPQALASDGFSLGEARCYARGSLVLLGADTLNGLHLKKQQRIAIANPRSAPYGQAAQQVLLRLIPEKQQANMDRQIVSGNNVQQAYQFYSSGAASLALVARSLSDGQGVPIPQDWHSPIRQFAIVSASSQQVAVAEQFLKFLLSPQATTTLQRFGYQPCS